MKKKSVITWLVIAFVLLAMGVVLAGVGYMLGGKGNIERKLFNINIFGDEEEFAGESDSYEGVERIKVDVQNAAVELLPSQDGKFKVEYAVSGEASIPKINYDNGILSVKQDKRVFIINIDLGSFFQQTKRVIKVYIPDNAELNEIDIETNNGSIKVDNEVLVDKLHLNTSNGAIDIEGLTCNKSADIKTSNGSVICDGTFYETTYIKTSNGKVDIVGKYYGDIDVKTSNGRIDVDIEGDERDYNLDIDTSNGSIKVNGDKKSDDYEKDNDAKNDLKLKTSNGSVDVTIE